MSTASHHLHHHKLNASLLKASCFGSHKVVILLIEAGANNFQDCIAYSQHANHVTAFLRLCQAAYEDDRIAISILVEPSEDAVSSHPRFPALLHHRSILLPLLSTDILSITTPIHVAVKKQNIMAAGLLLMSIVHYHKSDVVWHKLNLDSIPKEWMMMLDTSNVSHISLSFNALKLVPTEVLLFTSLIKFQAAFNQILFVPCEIFQLPSIEIIDLSHNKISAIASSASSNTHVSHSLSNLNLSDNMLKDLPAYFMCCDIKVLDLSQNLFSTVPKCVHSLVHLQSLNLSGNLGITHVPYELGGLQCLRSLQVDGLPYAQNIPHKLKHTLSPLSFIQNRYKSLQTLSHADIALVGPEQHSDSMYMLACGLKSIEIDASLIIFQNSHHFRSLHEVFRLSNTAYIVVWDYETSSPNPNVLHHTLRCLHICHPEATVFIFVCWKSEVDKTMKDEVEQSLLYSHALWKDVASFEIIHTVITTDKSSSCYQEMLQLLKQVLQKVQFAVEAPKSYYKIAHLVREKANVCKFNNESPILTADEFLDFISSGPNLLCHRELPELRKFLTAIGILLFVPSTHHSVCDIYVIDRSWFCRILGHMVSSEFNSLSFGNFSGILAHEAFIDLLKCPGLDVLLLDALRLFVNNCGIAISLSSQKWLIPSLLSTSGDHLSSDFSSQFSIRRQYTFSFTPATFWGRLIGHLVIRMRHLTSGCVSVDHYSSLGTSSRKNFVDWAYWDRGILCWENACDLLYSIEAVLPSGIIRAEGLEIRTSDSLKGQHMMKMLMYTIECILSNWYPEIWQSTEIWVPCTHCIKRNTSVIPLIPFRDVIFSVSKCVKIECVNHPNEKLPISQLAPDLLADYISQDLFLPPRVFEFDPLDKSNCLSFNSVYKGKYNDNIIAVKSFQSVKTKNPERFLLAWLEFQTLSHVYKSQCPNIIQVIGLCPEPLSLAFPLAQWCSLEEVLQVDVKLSVLVRHKMIYQLCIALKALHSEHIIHRNVCLSNILVYSLSVDDDVNIKLGGFSSATLSIFQGVGRGLYGKYPAPEMIKNASFDYDERVDVFAYAFVAYEIITRQKIQFHSNLTSCVLSSPLERPDLTPLYAHSPYLVPLVDKCWNACFSRRPFATDVLEHFNDPINFLARGGELIHKKQEFFSASAQFCYNRSSFQTSVFISSGPLNGEGKSYLTNISYPKFSVKNSVILPSEFVLCMCCAGPYLWVSLYNRKVLVYVSASLKLVHEFNSEDSVVAMVSNPTVIFLGYESGSLCVFNASDEKPLLPKCKSTVFQGTDMRCMTLSMNQLVCASKDKLFFVDSVSLEVVKSCQMKGNEIKCIAVANFQDTHTIWVSFRRSPTVVVMNAQNGCCYDIDCSRISQRERNSVWVLTSQVVLDTVWLGLNTGEIQVFNSVSSFPDLVTWYEVHAEEVRCLLLLHPPYMGPSATLEGEDYEGLIHSTGCFPESVAVLSFGQGTRKPLPLLDNRGCLLHEKKEDQGLYVFALEGVIQSTARRIATREKVPSSYHTLGNEQRFDDSAEHGQFEPYVQMTPNT